MNTKDDSTDEHKVIVIWISSAAEAEEGLVHVVSDNYTGESRVYQKGNIDPRCGEVPYVPELGLALVEMSENPGPMNARQIPLTEAKKYGIC